MAVIRLPIIQMNGNHYFVDARLKEIRNVANPHDCVPFDEAFVKVKIPVEHLVLNNTEAIQKAKDLLCTELVAAYETDGGIRNLIETEPASKEEVENHLEELLKELENDNDQKE